MFAFLNTRLRWAEVSGFFANLMMMAFGRFEPFHRAVVEAWCLDEDARYHSGLVWWAIYDEVPFVLRENTKKCPFGVPLPDVRQKCGCPLDKSGRWVIRDRPKRGVALSMGSSFTAQSSCCKYLLSLTLVEEPPRVYDLHGIGYVLDTWPGVGQFDIEGRRKEDTSQGTGTSEAKVVQGGDNPCTQKRPRMSDADAGPSKRREG